MDKNDTVYFEKKLRDEKTLLEKELATVGRINPENPSDWEATPVKMDVLKADEEEVADNLEGFEDNTAILKQLETRYNEVKHALEKMEKGTYGTCEVAGEEIEKDRLEANPAATTCKKHMDK